jgi:hypothetical protein
MQHLAEKYAALAPVLATLLAAYPQHVTAEQLAWPSYLWAAQLWYSYAIQARGVQGLHLQLQHAALR